MWARVRPIIRMLYRVLGSVNGFLYDFKRFFKYAGWRSDFNDSESRNYNAVMVYHGIEKSLSYKIRRPGAGWSNAIELFNIIKKARAAGNIGYHDKAAKKALEVFLSLPENLNDPRALEIREKLALISFNANDIHGTKEYGVEKYNSGILENPEMFFNSRYSLREFKDQIVSEDIIKRAVSLALKTPSVCNRQPWSVYHTSDQTTKDKALKFQSGNKPFGEKIPNLMVVTADLKAFFAGSEHYQHWIDGGLFSMSLMYAFHSLGVATCALNWSQRPSIDKKIREQLNIKNNHTIIMMLAIGFPDENNKVCISARKPLNEVYNELQIRL